MVSLLLPALVAFLAEPSSLKSANKIVCTLHEYALQRLLHIGSQYTSQFRAVMHSVPAMKGKLEVAVKAQHLSKHYDMDKSTAMANRLASQPQKPTIQLKTDFSNFKG